MELGVWGVVVGAGLFAGGLVCGLLLAEGGRANGRLRRLERELAEERERAAAYRDSVATHFGGTSDLFRDLTQQYSSLYAHLAEGARELCPDHAPELGNGFASPALPPAAPGEAPESSATTAG